MLTPEEKMMIQDIRSLIDELEQADNGAQNTGDIDTEPVQMSADEPDGDEGFTPPEGKKKDEMPSDDEINKAMKTLAKFVGKGSASADGTTGSDDADTRIYDDQDDITEQNLSQVAKMLTAMSSKGRTVAKSKGKSADEVRKEAIKQRVEKRLAEKRAMNQNNDVAKAVTMLANVVKSIADESKQNTMAVSNILEGMGIADKIKGQPVVKSQPIVNRPIRSGNQAVLKDLHNQVSNLVSARTQQPASVQKSLSGVMGMLFNQ